VIGAAIAVHRELGPGLLEAIYEKCLAYELHLRGHDVEQQRIFSIRYKGMNLPAAYRTDLVVDDRVVVEVKSIAQLEKVHSLQLRSYLRLSGYAVGLLINFNVPVLKAGIRRIARPEPQKNFPSNPLQIFPERS
jgi:GxxExxY protein